MRTKDLDKQEAILRATIELTNEIGYNNISMAKIAKRAGVSSGTLYVYYENKEDMIKKIYLETKREILQYTDHVVAEEKDIIACIRKMLYGLIEFSNQNPEKLLFLEQSSNLPLIIEAISDEENLILEMYGTTGDVYKRGVQEKVLIQETPEFLANFCYSAITQTCKQANQQPILKKGINYDALVEMCIKAISI